MLAIYSKFPYNRPDEVLSIDLAIIPKSLIVFLIFDNRIYLRITAKAKYY